jgi:hypothetical protein
VRAAYTGSNQEKLQAWDDTLMTTTGVPGMVARGDVVGVDVAGAELFRFDKEGRDRFKSMYLALLQQATDLGKVLTFRPHVGEGAVDPKTGKPWNRDDDRQRTEDGTLKHQDRAHENISAIIMVLRELAAQGALDPSKVVIRFGHATMTDPDQAAAMAALGVIAEVNLTSNVRTGAADQTVEGEDGRPAEEPQFDDHSLLTLLFYKVPTILSTDAHSVMSTTMGQEYDRAYMLIEDLLAGRRTVRVRAQDAQGRGVDLGNGQVELSRDDLTAAELQQFMDAYERLHQAAAKYGNNPAGSATPEIPAVAMPGSLTDVKSMSAADVEGFATDATQETISIPNHGQLRAILEGPFQGNWFLMKDCLIHNSWPDGTPATAEQQVVMKKLMKAMLSLRTVEFNNLLRKIRDVDLALDPEGEKLSPKARLDWGYAGSDALTSDVDVNLKGPLTHKVVALFNKQWKSFLGYQAEAGITFDVNVYGLDFMHSAKVEKDPNDPKHATIVPGKELGVELQDEENQKRDAEDQEISSLLHVRRYMPSDAAWEEYKEGLLSAKGAEDAGMRDKLTIVDARYRKYKAELDAKVNELMPQALRAEQDMELVGEAAKAHERAMGAVQMEAANRIYEQKLETVALLRKRLATLVEMKKGGDQDVDELIELTFLSLREALSESLMFANEAYTTDGAINHVVVGMQIGGKKKKDLNLDTLDVELTQDEFLHSFNEQVGDCLKECLHHSNDLGGAAYKAGKYIARMLIAAQNLGITTSADYEALKALSDLAVSLKGDPNKSSEEMEEKCATKARALGFATVAGLREAIVRMGIDVPVQLRGGKQDAPPPAPVEEAPQVQPQVAQTRQTLLTTLGNALKRGWAWLTS